MSWPALAMPPPMPPSADIMPPSALIEPLPLAPAPALPSAVVDLQATNEMAAIETASTQRSFARTGERIGVSFRKEGRRATLMKSLGVVGGTP